MCVNTCWAGVYIQAAVEETENSPPSFSSNLEKWTKNRKLMNGREQAKKGFLQKAGVNKANAGVPGFCGAGWRGLWGNVRQGEETAWILLQSPVGFMAAAGPWDTQLFSNSVSLNGNTDLQGERAVLCGEQEGMGRQWICAIEMSPVPLQRIVCAFSWVCLLQDIISFGTLQGFYSAISIVYSFLSQTQSWLLRKVHTSSWCRARIFLLCCNCVQHSKLRPKNAKYPYSRFQEPPSMVIRHLPKELTERMFSETKHNQFIAHFASDTSTLHTQTHTNTHHCKKKIETQVRGNDQSLESIDLFYSTVGWDLAKCPTELTLYNLK